jgi:hypothetical protein
METKRTIYEKLLGIQGELKAPKNQYNSFGKYKYRNCEDILEALKPLLLAYGCSLVITDEVKEIAGSRYIQATAILMDAKDREAVSVSASAGFELERKGMDLSQIFGSASSYARKYCLNGLFLIDDTKDADATNDHLDNNKPVKPTAKPTAKPSQTFNYLVTDLVGNKDFEDWLFLNSYPINDRALPDGKIVKILTANHEVLKLKKYEVKI